MQQALTRRIGDRVMSAALAAAFGACGMARAQCSAWIPGPTISTSVKRVLTMDPDGAGPLGTRQYFVSDYSMLGWDGQAFTASASFQNLINSVCAFNNQIDVGGAFHHVLANDPFGNYVVSMNPTAMTYTGVGDIGATALAVAVYPAPGNGAMSLYAATANNIKYWNGTTWVQVATVSGTVLCATTYQGNLILGGSLAMVGGAGINGCVARYNGLSWNSLGTAPFGPGQSPSTPQVFALETYNGRLYAGGNFSSVGNNLASCSNVNGEWTAVPFGVNFDTFSHGTPVKALQAHNGALIVGGYFVNGGGQGIAGLARYHDIQGWSNPFGTVTAPITALGSDRGELYVCQLSISGVASTSRWSETNSPPIVQQPVSPGTVCSPFTLSVAVAPGYNPTYRWRRNGLPISNISGSISGATSPTLHVDLIFPGNSGSYDCVIITSCNSVTTTPVTVTCLQPLQITGNLPPVTMTCATGAFIGVGYVGTLTGSRWQALLSGGWTDLPNSTTFDDPCGWIRNGGSTLTLNPGVTTLPCTGEQLWQAGRRFRVILNGPPCQDVMSSETELQFYTPPEITEQPQNLTISHNQAASFDLTLDMHDVPGQSTFFWETLENGNWVPAQSPSGCENVTGAVSYTPQISIAPGDDLQCGGVMRLLKNGRQFRCHVYEPCGELYSNPATLTLCIADFNGDGAVDFFDYLDFVDVFSALSWGADVNLDGAIDFFDYLDFVDAFSAGC